MTSRSPVQRLYAFGRAAWYDPFRAVWSVCVSRRSEDDLDWLFRLYVRPESRILDLGCGTGINRLRLQRLGLQFAAYRGVDFSPDMLARARARFGRDPSTSFELRDVTNLASERERYDLVVATWLLSHLTDRRAFVRVAADLVAPGGHLVLVYFSAASWFARTVMRPLGERILLADPVRLEEEAEFGRSALIRRYALGMVTLMDLPSGQ